VVCRFLFKTFGFFTSKKSREKAKKLNTGEGASQLLPLDFCDAYAFFM
jgi:hypothetical protein